MKIQVSYQEAATGDLVVKVDCWPEPLRVSVFNSGALRSERALYELVEEALEKAKAKKLAAEVEAAAYALFQPGRHDRGWPKVVAA